MDSIAWTSADARSLGRRIKEIREERGLTQEKVAFAAGLTRAHYALLETGQSSSRRTQTWANPKISTLASVAAVLEVPMTRLYAFDGQPHADAVKTARMVLDPSRDRR